MAIKVGDRYPWNKKGAVCQVTQVQGRKVKFEVFGGVPISGSMRLSEFKKRFKS